MQLCTVYVCVYVLHHAYDNAGVSIEEKLHRLLPFLYSQMCNAYVWRFQMKKKMQMQKKTSVDDSNNSSNVDTAAHTHIRVMRRRIKYIFYVYYVSETVIINAFELHL